MVQVFAFCIDRYEAPNVAGEYPLVMESALTAEKWCGERGKRLCGEEEWERACAGPQACAYPYGNAHEDARCADERPWINKDEPTITQWPEKPAMGEVTRLYQAEKSGTRKQCVSGYGVFDMTGNVEEWVVSKKKPARPYEHVLKGCYWSGCYGGSKPTCTSTNAAHADAFKFYETGFRCCKDAARP
jgi:formylglycine-generating enzyme